MFEPCSSDTGASSCSPFGNLAFVRLFQTACGDFRIGIAMHIGDRILTYFWALQSVSFWVVKRQRRLFTERESNNTQFFCKTNIIRFFFKFSAGPFTGPLFLWAHGHLVAHRYLTFESRSLDSCKKIVFNFLIIGHNRPSQLAHGRSTLQTASNFGALKFP